MPSRQDATRRRPQLATGTVKHAPKREPRRSSLRLSLAEREEISRGLAAGEPVREIARRLGRAPSTVCREVAANGGRDQYRACAADRRAVRGMRRPKPVRRDRSGGRGGRGCPSMPRANGAAVAARSRLTRRALCGR
jgi:Helix-turn-helix domain